LASDDYTPLPREWATETGRWWIKSKASQKNTDKTDKGERIDAEGKARDSTQRKWRNCREKPETARQATAVTQRAQRKQERSFGQHEANAPASG
jgi:hypothetical protein